jgi:hypothetical protein
MVRKHHLRRFRALIARLIAWLVFDGPVIVTTGRIRLLLDPRSGRFTPLMAGGAPDDDDDDQTDDDDTDDGQDDDDTDDDQDDDGEGEKDLDFWKRMARKHESRSKREKRRADELAAKQAELDAATQSEQQKALEKARKEGREEALTEAQKERRADRLEVAVTRIAARGVQLGDNDDELTKFADPEDALVFIERAIARGDIDADDIFNDDHKVDTDALADELADLLKRKPRLAAGATDTRNLGDSDAGKGSRRKSPDEETVEDHLKKVQKTR